MSVGGNRLPYDVYTPATIHLLSLGVIWCIESNALAASDVEYNKKKRDDDDNATTHKMMEIEKGS